MTDEETAILNEVMATVAAEAIVPEEAKAEVAAPAPAPEAEAKVEEKPDPIKAVLEKVAAMEAALAEARKPQPPVPAPDKPAFDPQSLLSSPLATLEALGISPDTFARELLLDNARRTGQPVTPELQAYHYANGAKQAALTEVGSVKKDLEDLKASVARERFDLGIERATVSLTDYPALAAAQKNNSAAFKELLAEDASRLYASGIKDPKQVLTKMEEQYAKLQRVLAPPASAPTSPEGGKTEQRPQTVTSASLRGAPAPSQATTPEEFKAQFFKEHNINR